jgi:hypothetical protein
VPTHPSVPKYWQLEKLAQVVRLQTDMQEISYSNFYRDTDYLELFFDSLQSFQANTDIAP